MFHKKEYSIRVKELSGAIHVSLVHADTASMWEETFTEEIIELITKKTDYPKTYRVFLKMLYSALDQNSETVVVDVIAPRDLEELRERKKRESQGITSQNSRRECKLGPKINHPKIEETKMFIILTHIMDYDQAHYPLSLKKVNSESEGSHLVEVIGGLKKELSIYKSGVASDTKSFYRAEAPEQSMLAGNNNPLYQTSGTFQNNILANPGINKPYNQAPTFASGPFINPGSRTVVNQGIDPSYNQPIIGHSSSPSQTGQSTIVQQLQKRIRELEQEKVDAEGLQVEEIETLGSRIDRLEEIIKERDEENRDLKEQLTIAEQEIEEANSAYQIAPGAGSAKERRLQQQVDTLQRKVNELLSTERLLRQELRKSQDELAQERKRIGVAVRRGSGNIKSLNSRSASKKNSRGNSPWKKSSPNSKPGRLS